MYLQNPLFTYRTQCAQRTIELTSEIHLETLVFLQAVETLHHVYVLMGPVNPLNFMPWSTHHHRLFWSNPIRTLTLSYLKPRFNIVTRRRKAAVCPSARRGFAEHVPVATRKAPLLYGELLEHVSTAANTTEEAIHCIQSHVDS
jgi:hypothetical protein